MTSRLVLHRSSLLRAVSFARRNRAMAKITSKASFESSHFFASPSFTLVFVRRIAPHEDSYPPRKLNLTRLLYSSHGSFDALYWISPRRYHLSTNMRSFPHCVSSNFNKPCFCFLYLCCRNLYKFIIRRERRVVDIRAGFST